MTTPLSARPPDFSLVLGGPLFQFYRRLHLSGDALQMLWRRVLVMTLFAWLPLLFLSVLDGHAIGGDIKIPFLYDAETHARFLIALPALIIGELVVYRRITPLIRRFVDRDIIVTEDLPKLDAAVNSALRIRNSVTVELALLVLVYTLGHWVWRSGAFDGSTWYAKPVDTHLHLTLPGYWYAFVSIPLFQFLLLRWYMRLTLWFRLLWQISRLNLHLSAAHPDGAGGIGFLRTSSYAFAPILFAEGTLLSGWIANRILYDGQPLKSFRLEMFGLVVFFLLCVLGPLLMFTPKLDIVKRRGSAQYGLLAVQYISAFEQKWLRGTASARSELLGTADIQSLADMGNSFTVVRKMSIILIGHEEIVLLTVATAAPLLPLTLSVFSLEELIMRLIKIIF
jgi:hypothetical protein